ncbi:hypothetical protein M8C21_013905, partial [Ambrosia artemisiifolia]
ETAKVRIPSLKLLLIFLFFLHQSDVVFRSPATNYRPWIQIHLYRHLQLAKRSQNQLKSRNSSPNHRFRGGGLLSCLKASDNVTSQGAGSSGTHDPPKKEENNKKRWNLRETTRKRVTFSSSNATKDEDIDHMLVDDESGSSSNSENEYKEPWDPYSNYPVSLPLRPLGSGDPEVLNVEEFGKQVEYDETKINSALELGLSGPEDDNKKHIIFFQFPPQLPLDRVPVSSKDKEKAGSSSSNVSNKCGGLKDLPNGRIGKMLVYKSGAIKLKLGDTIFNVSSGTPSGSDRSAAIMNTKSKDCCVLGKVNKRAIVTPDLNSLLENIN